MSDFNCPECDWQPEPNAEYPEDRLIDHFEREHTNE